MHTLLADVARISGNKENKEIERAFINWTKCVGKTFLNVPISAALASRLDMYNSDEEGDNQESSKKIIHCLRYEFKRSGTSLAGKYYCVFEFFCFFKKKRNDEKSIIYYLHQVNQLTK